MTKRITFTTVTPLPPDITRDAVIGFLQSHGDMIDLNPLVTEHHPIPPPPHAEPEELSCAWYSITDRVEYLPGGGPGGRASGAVTYATAFHNTPLGLQTHSHAPMGLDIRGRWSVGGNMPGEPPEPQELGLGAPATGLYLREDVDFRCNVLLAGFVRKTMRKSHRVLVETLTRRAREEQAGARDADHDVGKLPPSFHGNAGDEDDRRPFISAGQNQGQPGQGPGAVAYQVRAAPPPVYYEMGSAGHERHGSGTR